MSGVGSGTSGAKEAVLDALLAELVGAVSILDDERAANMRDYWCRSELQGWLGHPGPLPIAVVEPASVEGLARAVEICRAHRTPMIPRGKGSGVVGGVLADTESVVISTDGLDGLRKLDEVDHLATFGAGTRGSEAEARVAEAGYTIGNWPQSIELSSVGGWVATRASGQYSTAYGNTEDMVHSLEAVLPDGSIYRSAETPRAAAGPDLRQLLLGSEGTLGIVSEVTFSLFRQPPASRRQAFHFATMGEGLSAMNEVLTAGWRPPVVRLYDAKESSRHFSGSVPDDRSMLIFLHEGPEGRPELEATAVGGLCVAGGGVPAEAAVVDRWFEHRNEVPSWSELFEQGVVADTIEVATTWSKLPSLYEAVTAKMGAVPGVLVASGHSSHAYRSGANLYFTFAAAVEPERMLETYDACWAAAMEATTELGAGIAHHHGIGRVRREWLGAELGSAGLSMLRAVKGALDPDDLMNPGVLIPEVPS